MRRSLIVCLLLLQSCSAPSPASFWGDFNKDSLKEHVSDQGPHGGRRSLWWRSDQGTFKEDDVMSFATDNGWTLVEDASSNLFSPRWIEGDVTVYAFKTGSDLIDPATDEANEVNGFVALKNDGSEMEVFHVWGE